MTKHPGRRGRTRTNITLRARPIEKALIRRIIDDETRRRLIHEGHAQGPSEPEALEHYVDWTEHLLDENQRLWDHLDEHEIDPPEDLQRGSFPHHPLPTRHDIAPDEHPPPKARTPDPDP